MPVQNTHDQDLRVIEDTLYAEDLHYHKGSGLLFATSEGDEGQRWRWFPP
jgi:hypothetical protein